MADSPVLHLHNSLRQAKERWAIFLGAGACYDYGIPTMAEIANILRKMIKDGKPGHGVSQSTLSLLAELCPDGNLIYGEIFKLMKEIDWEGKTVWSYSVDYHHDFALTPEGRVMILAGGRTLLFDRPDLFEGCAEGLSIHANYFLEIDPQTMNDIGLTPERLVTVKENLPEAFAEIEAMFG